MQVRSLEQCLARRKHYLNIYFQYYQVSYSRLHSQQEAKEGVLSSKSFPCSTTPGMVSESSDPEDMVQGFHSQCLARVCQNLESTSGQERFPPRWMSSPPLGSASWSAICSAGLFEKAMLLHLPVAQSPGHLDGYQSQIYPKLDVQEIN